MTAIRKRVFMNVLLSSIISKSAPTFPPPHQKDRRDNSTGYFF